MAQRVLLHLSLFSKHREEFDVPRAVTQQGVAQALGLSRSHIALELKKLLEEGSLETRLAHVRGAKSRRKVYFDTYQGERIATGLRERAHSDEARWIGPDGSPGKGAGTEVIRLARRAERPLSDVYLAVLQGEVVDLRPEPPILGAADIPTFVGRAKERAALEDWFRAGPPLMLITGLPGIGKTALARAFLADREGVWVKVFSFDSAASLVGSLATALARGGRSRLLAYLKGSPLDYSEVGFLLSSEASGLLLVFDDVTASPEASRVLRLLLDHPAPGSQLLLTARETPTFLGTKDRLEGRFAELRLGGLTRDDGRALLHALGREDGAEKAYELTQGHPLLLRLLAAGELPEAPPETEAYLFEEVLRDLEPSLQRALFHAAVYRRPIPPGALVEGGFTAFQTLLRKSLLVENGGGYEVHDMIAPAIRREMGDSLRSFHQDAARFWLGREEWIEAVHHLARGGRTQEARDVVRAHLEDLLQAGRGAELVRVLDELPAEPSVALARARALDYMGRWTEAQEAVEEGLQSATPLEESGLLLVRGRIRSKLGDLAGAHQAFVAAEASAKTAGAERERGLAWYGLGIVVRKEGKAEEALRDLERAIAAFEKTRSWRELGRARMEKGIVRLQEGRLDAAVVSFRLAEPLLARWKGDAAHLFTNLAVAHREADRREESLRALETSRRYAQEAGMIRAEGFALANAADLLARMGRREEAEAYCEEGEAIAESLGDPVMLSTCRANRGLIEKERGRLAEAHALYRESLEALEETDGTISRAMREVEMSDVLEKQGDSDGARALRRKAETVLGEDRVERLLRQLA